MIFLWYYFFFYKNCLIFKKINKFAVVNSIKLNIYMRQFLSLNHFSTPLQYILTISIFISVNFAQAQIGEVLWEEQFNSFNEDVWTKDIGDGCPNLCGFGNQELQSYEDDNVFFEEIPGEPGNNGLVLEARRENSGSRAFTSGKITTDDKLAIHYGVVEVRMQVPNLGQGLWPAAWMLGTANLGWPAIGEIDIMEMGFTDAGRVEQEPNSTVNNYVGANAFFPVPGVGPGNIAYDINYNKPYVADIPLNDRFVIYRIYWEPTQIRFTVIDNDVEYDLYEAPFPIDADSEITSAFTKPFFMLLNMAVGGTLPGTLTNESVTANLPAKMMVDYVRVSKWNGFGTVEVIDDIIAEETDVFGVFTDLTATDNAFGIGEDSEVYVFEETLIGSNEPPFEGQNVLAFNTEPSKGWFGAGITSLFGKNMLRFVENGVLKFKIKIPSDIPFIIGVNDNFTNSAEVLFPAGETKYGLVRNGEWGEAVIPISDFAGTIAFQDMSYLFRIGSSGTLPATSFGLAIDDVVWIENYTLGTETNELSKLMITPNPAHHILSLNGETTNLESAIISDISGKKMIELSTGFDRIRINHLQSGIYFITLKSNTGRVTHKFVKD